MFKARTYFPVLLVAAVLLCSGGCGTRETVSGDVGVSAPLPELSPSPDDRAFVTVENKADSSLDLKTMLVNYLQSERGINPAYSPDEAAIFIDVVVESVRLAESHSSGASGREMLQGGLIGTGLGVTLGGLADGRTGALWGAALGAAAGAGAMAATANPDENTYFLWELSANVRMWNRGQSGETTAPVHARVTTGGVGLTKDAALPRLGDNLLMEIVRAVRVR